MLLYKRLAKRIPDLHLKLQQARMPDTPEYYLRKTFFLSFLAAIGIMMPIFGFIKKPVVLLFFPLIFAVMVFYLIHIVDFRIKKMNHAISKEIIFAGRFLLVELESGVPLYQAFRNIGENYESIGPYFREVIERVELGTSMNEALNELISISPSPDLRRMLWQLLNSLKTGSAVQKALASVLDQIVREQQIAVKEYGRKLNPLAMFFMMIAIIIPSLGTIMLIVLTTFIGLNFDLVILLIIVGVIWFIQFMFLAMVRSSRPPVEM